jgi:hypothetical protein
MHLSTLQPDLHMLDLSKNVYRERTSLFPKHVDFTKASCLRMRKRREIMRYVVALFEKNRNEKEKKIKLTFF